MAQQRERGPCQCAFSNSMVLPPSLAPRGLANLAMSDLQGVGVPPTGGAGAEVAKIVMLGSKRS